ncbi:MAG: SAM-dependent methyltransferase [Pseudomonadota bacterium]|nr:SAM-dependent methyltransferase [Pseudomonadota bacterium]
MFIPVGMTPLETLIRTRIAVDGPIPVSEYMALALGHPDHGYYMNGSPFGADGDFITSPEISQVFGELIGLWAAVTWQQMGSPEKTVLIECGPGRGTLMTDLLRAAEDVPVFARTIEIHLVETSKTLRNIQAGTLSCINPVWHDSIETVPPGPTILIANEFIDALPIRQVTREHTGWSERCVGLTDDTLQFMPGSAYEDPAGTPIDAITGEVYEFRPAATAFVDELSARLATHPGAALIIDYGYERQSPGDTLQAVRDHQFADPLADPGEADLTAHVDFGALRSHGFNSGCHVFGPVNQAAFLRSLGIVQRMTALSENATPEQIETLYSSIQRLIDPGAMGTLFKAMVISHSGAPTPAGFEYHSTSSYRRND